MKIALAQTHIEWENKKANIDRAKEIVMESKEKDSRLVLFPEMSFTGFSMNTGYTKEKNDETKNLMMELSQKCKIAIGFGWVHENAGKCENHYTVIDCGNLISDYVKIHPFSFSGEDKFFVGGNAISWFVIDGMPFSSFICYDLRFPELFQIVADKVNTIIVPANWPQARSEHWKTLLKARAIENQVYVVGVNCVGRMGNIDYSGDSMAFDPEGKELVRKASGKETILYTDIYYDSGEYRKKFPCRNDRRVELYGSYYMKKNEN